MPTKYLESPNLTIGAFFVREIWAVGENVRLSKQLLKPLARFPYPHACTFSAMVLFMYFS